MLAAARYGTTTLAEARDPAMMPTLSKMNAGSAGHHGRPTASCRDHEFVHPSYSDFCWEALMIILLIILILLFGFGGYRLGPGIGYYGGGGVSLILLIVLVLLLLKVF
jgi:hypothetical protein